MRIYLYSCFILSENKTTDKSENEFHLDVDGLKDIQKVNAGCLVGRPYILYNLLWLGSLCVAFLT